jgi:hypothetical protein
MKRTLAGLGWPVGLCLAIALCLVIALGACDGDESVAPAPHLAPPFRHDDFYAELGVEADSFSARGGDWLEDLGDAPFYGLAYYAHTAPAGGTALAARLRAEAVINGVDLLQADLQEVAMSCLGLIEHHAATGDASALATLDATLDELDSLIATIGYYVHPGIVDSWALRTYGSTAITALLALINTEYALRVGGPRAAERLAFALEVASHIDAEAYVAGPRYAVGPDRPEQLDLYPNVSMALLNGRLFQLTGDARFRTRAIECYQAIQPLKLSDEPVRYYSPYSAADFGAQTTDYSTLSSHNYLMLSLAVLFEITGEPAYVEELDRTLDAMHDELYGSYCLSDVHKAACAPACDAGAVCVAEACGPERCGHAVLHHWIDGRPALPSDPEFFCSGCNLQLLYVMWYRKNRL